MSEPVESLGEALLREMARVRDIAMPAYIAIGLAFMRGDLDRATKALAEGDVVAMLDAYFRLKEYRE